MTPMVSTATARLDLGALDLRHHRTDGPVRLAEPHAPLSELGQVLDLPAVAADAGVHRGRTPIDRLRWNRKAISRAVARRPSNPGPVTTFSIWRICSISCTVSRLGVSVPRTSCSRTAGLGFGADPDAQGRHLLVQPGRLQPPLRIAQVVVPGLPAGHLRQRVGRLLVQRSGVLERRVRAGGDPQPDGPALRSRRRQLAVAVGLLIPQPCAGRRGCGSPRTARRG